MDDVTYWFVQSCFDTSILAFDCFYLKVLEKQCQYLNQIIDS